MSSHKDVVNSWRHGESQKGSRMFTDGTTIYSYGYHFPIATKIKGVILFNTDKYSSSTSKHQRYTRNAISECIECTTEEIKRAIDNEIVIVVSQGYKFSKISDCLEAMKKIYNQNHKRFPMQKIKEILVYNEL